MKKRLICYLIGSLCFFLYACEYQFSNDTFKEVEKLAPDASLLVRGIEDGEVLYNTKTIEYTFECSEQHELYEVSFFVDDNHIVGYGGMNAKEEVFYLETNTLEEGEHLFKIEAYFSTGNQSLANYNRQEVYTITSLHSFYVDNTPTPPVQIESIELKDGHILLKWDPSKVKRESNYMLNVQKGYKTDDLTISESEFRSGQFLDTLSVGAELTYKLCIYNSREERFSKEKKFFTNPVNFRFEMIDQDSYKVIWDRHLMYSNFDYYQIQYQYVDVGSELSTEGGEMIINEKPMFGISGHSQCSWIISLYRNSKEGNLFADEITIEELWGERFAANNYNELIYNEDLNSIIAISFEQDAYNRYDLKLYELDINDLSIQRSTLIENVDKKKGQIFSENGNLIIELGIISYVIDSDSFKVIKKIEAIDYLDNVSNVQMYYRNQNLFIVKRYSDEGVRVFDLSSREEIDNFDLDENFTISADGKYFANGNKIYKYINREKTLVRTIKESSYYAKIKFLQDQEKCIYKRSDKQYVMLDLKSGDLTVIGYIEGNFTGYDSSNQTCTFLGSNSGHLVSILNLKNLSVRTFEVYQQFDGVYRCLQNKLIDSKGLYLNLNEIK